LVQVEGRNIEFKMDQKILVPLAIIASLLIIITEVKGIPVEEELRVTQRERIAIDKVTFFHKVVNF